MPIYAYKCSACGHEQDVLQKMSDPVLVDCPECGRDTYEKQVTAAGFQLKGSGWYVTDFRNNGSAAKPAGTSENTAGGGSASSGGGDSSSSSAAPTSGTTSSGASSASGSASA